MAKKQRKSGSGGQRAGAGRPRKHPEGVTVRPGWTIPEPLVRLLEAAAQEAGCTPSECATAAVREWLARRAAE